MVNNSNNQSWLYRYTIVIVAIVTVINIALAGIALTAYQISRKVENEFEALDYIQIEIAESETEQDIVEELVKLALLETKAIEERAINYLSIFEGIGFAFAAIGVLFTFVALVAGFKYDDAMKQMDKSLQRMNEIDEQFQSRRQVLHESSFAQSLMLLAERQYKARDIEGALQTYQRALTFDENNPVVYYYIGYLQTHKNLLTQARDTLLKAIDLEPLPQTQAALGYTYRRIGDEAESRKNFSRRDEYYERADKHLSEALEASPRLVDVDGESWYGSLAGLHKRLGNVGDDETPEEERKHLQKARYYYGEAAKITPLSSYPQFNIAMITMRLEESIEAAKDEFEKTKKLIENELQAEHDNHWYWANLLLTKVALQEFDNLDDTVNSLRQLIPPEAKDVKPRIIEDIHEIQKIFELHKVDTQWIENVIQQLNETS